MPTMSRQAAQTHGEQLLAATSGLADLLSRERARCVPDERSTCG